MLKTVKILVLTFILSLLTFNSVYAMNIDMNLTNTNNSNNLYNNSATQNTNTSSTYSNIPINDDYSVSLSSMPEDDLGFTNILNIILIVIGILLILLGIAIMIRLK